MSFVYIIKSKKDSSFYTGITDDVHRRLVDNNSGKLKYTRDKRPWILWHVRESDSMSIARNEEIYLKKKNREFKESIKNV